MTGGPRPMRWLWALPLALTAACATDAEVQAWPDAARDAFAADRAADGPPDVDADIDRPDASPIDGRAPVPDAAEPDVGLDLDAGADPDPDAGVDLDGMIEPMPDAAEPEPDASWGPCRVDGVPGDCLPTGLCDGISTPGFCPGPRDIQCCTPEPELDPEPDPDPDPDPDPGACDPDVLLPPDDLVEPDGVGGCPPGMVPAGDVCIDRVEAALLEVLADGSTRPWSPYHNPGRTPVRAVAVPGAVPQGYIDGVQAEQACVAAGKRLCTDAEWLRACQGPDGWWYPYGPDRRDGVCNDARAQHPAVELFPDAENPFAHIQDACINQLPDGLTPGGEHPGCVTADGVFDMMGNLHEWTADPAGTFRGGFYVDTVRNGPGCLYRTTAHGRFHWDYSTGFRCCADP